MDRPPVTGVLGFGDLALDVATGELRRMTPADPDAPGGTLLGVLGARPARLLAVLARRHGQLVTRDEIQAALWADGTTVDFDQSINQYIRQLRQLLHDDATNPTWIQTLPARGYRFLVPSRAVGAVRDDVGAEAPPDAAPAQGRAVRTPSSTRGRWWRGFAPLAAIMLGLAVLLLAASDSTSHSRTGPGVAELDRAVRIAVLPLATAPGDEPRGVGIADELITAIGEAYAPNIEVIATRTARAYRGSTLAPDVARALGVELVLEGAVRVEGDRAQVRVSLVRGRDSAQIWAHVYEQPVQRGWGSEAAIAADVAHALGAALLPGRSRPEVALDPEAQQDYLRGRYLLRRGQPVRAAAAFTAVTTRFPRSARAWAARGLAELRSGGDRLGAASRAADTALELDPAHAEAHYVRATVALYGEWDPERARRHLDAAIAANPAFAEAHHDLAACYSAMGRHPEAIAAMQRAFALDPLAPEVVSDVGWFYYFARRYAEAATWCERTLALDPAFYWAHRCIVLARVRHGDPHAAVAAALADLRARHAPASVVTDVEAHGLVPYWRWDEGANGAPSDLGDRAVSRLSAGDRSGALDALEQAVASHRGWLLPFLAVDPTFDELRAEPRFAAVRRAVAAGAVP